MTRARRIDSPLPSSTGSQEIAAQLTILDVDNSPQILEVSGSNKKEVLLRSFYLEDDDERGSILAARNAFARTFADALSGARDIRLLWKSADAILKAVNDGSPDYLYTMTPNDSPEIMDSFLSDLLPHVQHILKEEWLVVACKTFSPRAAKTPTKKVFSAYA